MSAQDSTQDPAAAGPIGRYGPVPFLLTFITIIAIGLTLSLIERAPQAGLGGSEPDRHAGIIVQDQCSEVWLPEGWEGLAAAEARGQFDSHNRLKAHLDAQKRAETWYLIALRGHQLDGGTGVRRIVRTPYDRPEHLGEFRSILAAASRRDAPDPAPAPPNGLDLSHAAFLDMPDDFRGLSPVEAYAQLAVRRAGTENR